MMSSTTADGAVYFYLEDVAPDGRVTTYITEGELRLVDRKLADSPLPYVLLGPPHSFLREDVAPMVPGKIENVKLKLFATSVLVRRGHKIRIAIAGADHDTFEQIPAAGPAPRWSIHRDRVLTSYVDLPMKTYQGVPGSSLPGDFARPH